MPAVEGKVAVVTGASSGIGEAIVRELVGAGVIVAGLARRIDRVEALAAALKGQKGKLSAIKCDVTKEDDVISAFAWVEKNLGPPDFVVNNAGVLKQTMISNCAGVSNTSSATTSIARLQLCEWLWNSNKIELDDKIKFLADRIVDYFESINIINNSVS